MQTPKLAFSDLEKLSKNIGLELVSCISCEDLQEVLSLASSRLETWQNSGFAGEMNYMNRSAEIFSGFDSIMKETKSIACFVVPYSSAKRPALKPQHGQIARYAWGEDYHIVMKKKLKQLVSELGKKYSSLKTRVFSDAVPILERALASACDLGFVGKNTMLIRPGVGSYFFIAEVLLNYEVDLSSSGAKSLPVVDNKAGCSTCRSCLDDCPTQAFESAYKLDSRKCISYLTIEKRSAFTLEESEMLGDWLFGCDICQEVCPFNHSGTESSKRLSEFSDSSGLGQGLSLKQLLAIRDKTSFDKQFANSALLRTGREGLLRNASAVIANQKEVSLIKDLVEAYQYESSEMLRLSYQQAMKRLSPFADGADLKLLRANQVDLS